MTDYDEETLRMAAIAAIYSMLSANGDDDPGQVARKPGLAWSQDHRRMNMGQSSLMQKRASRSPWK